MAKKETKTEVKAEVKEEIIEQPAEVVETEVKAEVKETPTRIFYVEGYGNVIAKDEKDAKAKADAIIAKIRG